MPLRTAEAGRSVRVKPLRHRTQGEADIPRRNRQTGHPRPAASGRRRQSDSRPLVGSEQGVQALDRIGEG